MELKLSDAFIHKEEISDMEVTAHMLNINYGHNQDLMKKCKKLEEYSTFIAMIRNYQKTEQNLSTAIQLAMEKCIHNDILADILKKERTVIMNNLLTEFDEEGYKEMLLEEGFEDGFTKGEEKFSALTAKLLEAKRYADLEKSTKDSAFREALYREFHIA